MAWQARASCRGVDIENMTYKSVEDYAEEVGEDELPYLRKRVRSMNQERLRPFLTLCDDCPVKKQCIDSSNPADRWWTIRGGKLPKLLSTLRPHGSDYRPPNSNAGEYALRLCPEGHSDWAKRSGKGGKTYTYCAVCNRANGRIDV